MPSVNPLLSLDYRSPYAELGEEFADPVLAAEFPQARLRFRNDAVLAELGLDPATVTDEHFVDAFGRFQGRGPFLAMRYHGYQFGTYNPELGDGRGFLYGQLRDRRGEWRDFGTKGSGQTPWSRSGDGRLTLKGGVREVLASETLQRLGVTTCRILSLVETGEPLWRGDEPSPTRSSVMVRYNRTHVRFGSFERLHYFGRKDLIARLLDHVIDCYYPHLQGDADAGARFYAELVERTADLAAQWMAAGFCHAVLNTDNMSVCGESFDYGPWAFLDRFQPQFTAAYFDHSGRYRYENQPGICRLNLELLQEPLSRVIPGADLEVGLAGFSDRYQRTWKTLMLRRLGFAALPDGEAEALLRATLTLLHESRVGYNEFFAQLRQHYRPDWASDLEALPDQLARPQADPQAPVDSDLWQRWRDQYYRCLGLVSDAERQAIATRLAEANPRIVPIRPVVESVWEPITVADDWEPLAALLAQIAE